VTFQPTRAVPFNQPSGPRPRRKRGLVAFLLNIALAGLGAAYADEPREALAMFLGNACAWLLAAWAGGLADPLPVITAVVIIARTEVLVRRWNRREGYVRRAGR
jgi:hypothetical protein